MFLILDGRPQKICLLVLQIILGLEGAFLLWGVYLCVITRSTPTEYNESHHISLSLYALFFTCVIVVPLLYGSVDNPSNNIVITGMLYLRLSSWTRLKHMDLVLSVFDHDRYDGMRYFPDVSQTCRSASCLARGHRTAQSSHPPRRVWSRATLAYRSR
jgi:hypothetical protein